MSSEEEYETGSDVEIEKIRDVEELEDKEGENEIM